MKSKRPASAPCPQIEMRPETFCAGALYGDGMLASVAAFTPNAVNDNNVERMSALISVEHLELLLRRRGRQRNIAAILRHRGLAVVGEHIAKELAHARRERLA